MPSKASTGDLHVAKLFSVKDYVCVVTGGGSGIGLMAAQALAANGAKVCTSSNTSVHTPNKRAGVHYWTSPRG